MTDKMVHVNCNSYLKCRSPAHKFEEEDKCIYGHERLMKKPCMGCQEGGHHVDVCLNNQQPSLEAQDPNGKELLDTRFGN